MDPYSQDKTGFPFQKPFQPGGAAPQGGALRPFTAVDLAPPASPAMPAPLGPTVSPFLKGFGSPFEAGSAAQPAHDLASPTSPAREPRPKAGFPIAGPKAADEYTPAPPAARAMPPLPAAARQSQIMAASDLHGANGSALKPRFFLTSTAVVDGYPIQVYLDVISVEIVLPKDVLFRNPAPYGELHRLKAAEDQLQKVKTKAIEELTDKARALQADGIVGVTVTFTNLDTVCCLCSAVGTAVKIA